MSYCTIDDVRLLLGDNAVGLWLDDQDQNSASVAQVMSYVDGSLNSYLDQQYDRDQLTGNAWVRSKATILAANMLSMRRGNPEVYRDEVRRIYEELEKIRNGMIYIPGAIVRSAQVPSIRTQHVNHRLPGSPLLIDPYTSTGGDYEGEMVGPSPYWFY